MVQECGGLLRRISFITTWEKKSMNYSRFSPPWELKPPAQGKVKWGWETGISISVFRSRRGLKAWNDRYLVISLQKAVSLDCHQGARCSLIKGSLNVKHWKMHLFESGVKKKKNQTHLTEKYVCKLQSKLEDISDCRKSPSFYALDIFGPDMTVTLKWKVGWTMERFQMALRSRSDLNVNIEWGSVRFIHCERDLITSF